MSPANDRPATEPRPTKKDYIEAAHWRIQEATAMGMGQTAIRVELSTMWEMGKAEAALRAAPRAEGLDPAEIRDLDMALRYALLDHDMHCRAIGMEPNCTCPARGHADRARAIVKRIGAPYRNPSGDYDESLMASRPSDERVRGRAMTPEQYVTLRDAISAHIEHEAKRTGTYHGDPAATPGGTGHCIPAAVATGIVDKYLLDFRAAPRAEGLPEPGLDMTPEQTIDWWEQVAYSLGARAERAENTLRDLTQRVAEATIRFPTLTEDTLLRDSFHAASRLIEGVDRE